MPESNTIANAILMALRQHEGALLELNSRLNELDDRLEFARLEILSVAQSTWHELSKRSSEGSLAVQDFQEAAIRFREAGLLLLEMRLPAKAARLADLPSLINQLDVV